MPRLIDEIVTLVRDVCENSDPVLDDLDRPLLECGLDSLDYVSVLMAVEDKYEFDAKGLSFTESDMDKLQSVNAIAHHLNTLGVA